MNQLTQARWLRSTLQYGWLVAVLLLPPASARAAEEQNATKIVASSPATSIAGQLPWQRIVMIGASATAGFTAAEPLGGTNTRHHALGRYVDAALTVPHESVQNFGNAFFFFQPQLFAQQQITRALTNNPTLIIGLDFPFWFCYGEGDTDEERLQRFDQGLKLLEAIACPLVIGDIPDASAAVNKMLRPDQMPSLRAIATANARLKEWAAGRPHVTVVGLAEFMRKALANRAIVIHDFTLLDGQTRLLLQNDSLHPTPPGCAVLALAVLDAFQATRPGVQREEFVRDPKEIFRRAFKAPALAPADIPSAPK